MSTTAEWQEFLGRYDVDFPEPPASEEDVAAAEQRLGVRLPPSYRNFLLARDGWHSPVVVDLLPTKQLGWFRDLEDELLRAWSGPEMDSFADQAAVLRRCLLISDDDGGAGHYLMLDAGDVAEDGEWRAYEWWPGDGEDPEPYENFAVLVTTLWARATD